MAAVSWKAIVQSVSALDSSGRIEVEYAIFKDEELQYAQLFVTAAPIEIKHLIVDKLTALKTTFDTIEISIRVGDEILI